MYVGSTTVRGLHVLVYEAADLAMNEILADHAGRMGIGFTVDDGMRVTRPGRGVTACAAQPCRDRYRLAGAQSSHAPCGPAVPSEKHRSRPA
jgi:hypothetical protein